MLGSPWMTDRNDETPLPNGKLTVATQHRRRKPATAHRSAATNDPIPNAMMLIASSP
jgi:hypothetical protein